MTIDDFNTIKNKSKKQKIIAISISIGITLISLGISVATAHFIYTAITIIVAAFLEKGLTIKQDKEYNSAYKEYFVKISLSSLLENYNFDKDEGILKSEIDESKLIYTGDEYYSEDLSTGIYNNIQVKLSDIHIKRIINNGDNPTKRTIFKGKWMVFKLEKEFIENIQIAQLGYDSIKIDFKDLFSTDINKYKSIKIGDKEINLTFKIFAKTKEQAEKILNENIISKIKKLDEVNKGKILLCFTNDKLHVGLYDNNDSFEAPSYFIDINEEKEFNKINKDLKIILDFVSDVVTDNSIFKQQ